MAKETILIKFEKTGDTELINAINKLGTATQKLQGSKRLGGVTQKSKQLSSAFSSLSAKIIAHNRTWTELGVSHKTVQKAMFGNKVALEKLRMSMIKARETGLLGVRNNRLLANSFATLRSQLLLVSFGALLIEKALVSLVRAYGRQQASNEKLRQGLANVLGTTDGVTQRLIDYSSALQQVTAIGDEVITTGMVQFTTFGLNEEAIKSLTPQVLNVARAIQTVNGELPNLNSLFIAFGKATTTGIGTLTRYGVVLTMNEREQLSNMNANESAIEIAKILERQYGGLAEAYAKTTAGMLESAEVARGDMAEAFGKVLAPIVLNMSIVMKKLFESMSPERITRFFSAVLTGALAFGLLSGKIQSAVKALIAFNIAQARTGWGAIATAIGVASFALAEYFDLFDDGIETLTDAQKRQLEYLKSQDELADIQEKSVEGLQKRLDLLNATSEIEKMQIQLGHEASGMEIKLMNAIINKTEALKAEKEILKEMQKQRKQDAMLHDDIIDIYDRISVLKLESTDSTDKEIDLLKEQIRLKNSLKEIDIGLVDGNIINLKIGKELTDKQTKRIQLLLDEYNLRIKIIKKQKDGDGIEKEAIQDQIGATGQLLGAMSELASADKKSAIQGLHLAKASATASAIAGSLKAFEKGGVAGFLTGTALLVQGLARVTQINQQIKEARSVPKLEHGGLIGGRRHSQGGTIIEAEQGEFIMNRSAVQSVGLENLNRINQGATGGITLNVSGNVMSQDFVEGELADQIKDAIRRGTDFGIT